MQPIRVVYHCAAMNHWKDVVRDQFAMLRRVGLTELTATFVGHGLDWLRLEADRHDLALTVDRADANTDHYETFAMLLIERLAKDESDARPILYFHTKGVSVLGHLGKHRWRKLMERYVVENWRENLIHLQTYDAVGVNWRDYSHSNYQDPCPHFSGNFWAANPSYIRQLPDFTAYHCGHGLRRTSCEFWIGANRAIKYLCVAQAQQDFCDEGYDWDEMERRIDRESGGVKLNLGCWTFYHDGWVNIDLDRKIRADLYEDVETLPSVKPDSCDAIYAGHVAEHLIDLKRGLSRWLEVLKPGGECVVVTPDLPGAIRLWRHGQRFPGIDEPPERGILGVATGVCAVENCEVKELQLHRRAFDASCLSLCMEAVGFMEVHEVDDHPLMVVSNRRLGWQIAVQGRKPRG